MAVPLAREEATVIGESRSTIGISSGHSTVSGISGNKALALLLWSFIAIGLIVALINRSWPVARNALNYARAALDIIDRGFDLSAVVRDQALAGGKPILFSVIAAPFVWLSDANTATIVASAIGTAFFLWTIALALPRLNRRCGLDPGLLPLEFVLAVFNPLVLYQFWSGYPDSLFAGLVVLAFVLTDIIASAPERDTRWHIVGLGVTLCAAIYTKLYGAMLGLLCPMYLLLHSKQLLTRSTNIRSKISLLCVSFGVAAAVLTTAKLGINPLLVLDPDAEVEDYFGGLTDPAARQELIKALTMVGVTILLTFHAALLSLLTPGAWRAWAVAPGTFAAVYLLGLLPFSGAAYNMRYFLPAFPFLVPAIASGVGSMAPTTRRITLGTYAIVASMLVLNFNVAWVQDALHPTVAKLYKWQPMMESWLDNLRLPVQMALKRQIDAINATVPSESTLYWASDYNGIATHGLAHHLGVRKDLDVRYVLEPSDPEKSTVPVFLTVFTSFTPPERVWRAPHWATPTRVGYGLFRLDPYSVELVSTSGDSVQERLPVRLRVNIDGEDRLKVNAIEFIEANKTIATVSAQPYELTLRNLSPGRHEIEARVHCGGRCTLSSKPAIIYVGVPALARAARETNDFVMECCGGSENAVQDLLLLDRNLRLGIRFDNIIVPQGAHIASAYLELTAAGPARSATELNVHGQLAGNARGLSFQHGDLSRRTRTAAGIRWELGQWANSGEQSQSPDLAPIIEEVVRQPGWRSGNAIMLILNVSGGKARQARAIDEEDGRGAPTLSIELRREP